MSTIPETRPARERTPAPLRLLAVGGSPLVENASLLTADEDEIARTCRTAARSLMEAS